MEVKGVSVDKFQQFKFITIINKPVKNFLDNASIIYFLWGPHQEVLRGYS